MSLHHDGSPAAPDGLELTKDAYLKPAMVKRAKDECVHVMAPRVGRHGRALLTDGGVKFLLAVQALGRSI